MNERWRFPWGPFLAGSALMLLALATIRIRGSVVLEGQQLMLLEHRRAALNRHIRDLRLDLQESWAGMDGKTAAPRSRGGRNDS